MSLLQAMSAGLPSIVTRVGGMEEVAGLSEGSLLVPVGDAAAMGEAMGRIAHDAVLRRRLGEMARSAFREHFTLERMHDAYLRLYAGER